MTSLSQLSDKERAWLKLARAATPGPWRYLSGSHGVYADELAICTVCGPHKLPDDGRRIANAAFITASRTAVPALLAEVSRLRGALAKLLRETQLLQQNAEGCAVNHYQLDFQEQGLPGWLADTQKAIDEAVAALAPMPAAGKGG